MIKKSRTLMIAIAMIAVSSVLVISPKNAQAFFLDPFEGFVETMLISLTDGMDNVTLLITTLSTDIGTMADRILIMADNIGIMADRIVESEQLMADLVVTVTNSQGPSALLTSPIEGEIVSLSSSLNISLSTASQTYTLFMSNTADMTNATNILVENGDTAPATSRAVDYVTGNKLYLAVKDIDGDTMGPISNTVMINLIQ